MLSDVLQFVSNSMPTMWLIIALIVLYRHTWEYNSARKQRENELLKDWLRTYRKEDRTLNAIKQDNEVMFPDCPQCGSKNNPTVIGLGVCVDCYVKRTFANERDKAQARANARYSSYIRDVKPPGPPPPPPPLPRVAKIGRQNVTLPTSRTPVPNLFNTTGSSEWIPPVRNAVMAHERGLGPGNAATNKGLTPPPGERKYTKPPKLPPADPNLMNTVWRTVFDKHAALSSMLDINVEDNPFVAAMRRAGYDEYKRWKPFFNGGFPKCSRCLKTMTTYFAGRGRWECNRCGTTKRPICPACDCPLADRLEHKLKFSPFLQRSEYGDPLCRLCGALDMKHPDNDHNVTRRCPKCSQLHNLGITCTACRKCGHDHGDRVPCIRSDIRLDNYITK